MSFKWDQHITESDRASATEADFAKALQIPRLRIYREADTCTLEWEFLSAEPAQDPDRVYGWAVERSGSPGSGFRLLTPSPRPWESRTFRDDTPPRGRDHTWRLYYRLLLCSKEEEGEWEVEQIYGYNAAYDKTGAGTEVYGQTWGPEGIKNPLAPGQVKKARKMFALMVRKVAGTSAWLYRPRWADGPCPVCVNPHTGTPSTPGAGHCPSCLDTRYAGGFYSPMAASFVDADQVAHLVNIPSGQLDTRDRARVLLPYWPPVQPDDFLRTVDGDLHRVTAVVSGHLFGFPLLGLASITQVERTHPLSRVALPDGFRERARAPRKVYGRVANLDAWSKSMDTGVQSSASHRRPLVPEENV